MRRIKFKVNRGTYMPVLMKVLDVSEGPIVELGTGPCSTLFLHWFSIYKKRKLMSYESDLDWFKLFSGYNTLLHTVTQVTDWNMVDLTTPCSVAFVDHAPDEHRKFEIAKLTHVDYVIAHDAEARDETKYNYKEILDLFKYSFLYKNSGTPYTLVLSNTYDLSFLNELNS